MFNREVGIDLKTNILKSRAETITSEILMLDDDDDDDIIIMDFRKVDFSYVNYVNVDWVRNRL
jgi:hypothetical protein